MKKFYLVQQIRTITQEAIVIIDDTSLNDKQLEDKVLDDFNIKMLNDDDFAQQVYDTEFDDLELKAKLIHEKDLDSFRDASYDKDIILDNEFKFNFQHSFEKWFYSYTDKIKLGEYYIVQTKGGVANPIHSDTCPITNVSKTKINFTFADYNSCLEYFKKEKITK